MQEQWQQKTGEGKNYLLQLISFRHAEHRIRVFCRILDWKLKNKTNVYETGSYTISYGL